MTRSLEVIVRPVIPPEIRPAALPTPAQPEEDQEKRLEIAGRSAKCINLSHNRTNSAQFGQQRVEQFRVYDEVRVFNPDTHEQYVDVEVTHYMQWRSELGQKITHVMEKPAASACTGTDGNCPASDHYIIRRENVRQDISSAQLSQYIP